MTSRSDYRVVTIGSPLPHAAAANHTKVGTTRVVFFASKSRTKAGDTSASNTRHKGWRYKRIKYQAQRLAIKAHQIPDKCPYMTSCMVCGHNGRVKRGSSLHGNGCGFCLLKIHATLFIVKMPRQPRSCGESVWRPKICPDGIISGLDMYKFTERMSRA